MIGDCGFFMTTKPFIKQNQTLKSDLKAYEAQLGREIY